MNLNELLLKQLSDKLEVRFRGTEEKTQSLERYNLVLEKELRSRSQL